MTSEGYVSVRQVVLVASPALRMQHQAASHCLTARLAGTGALLKWRSTTIGLGLCSRLDNCCCLYGAGGADFGLVAADHHCLDFLFHSTLQCPVHTAIRRGNDTWHVVCWNLQACRYELIGMIRVHGTVQVQLMPVTPA